MNGESDPKHLITNRIIILLLLVVFLNLSLAGCRNRFLTTEPTLEMSESIITKNLEETPAPLSLNQTRIPTRQLKPTSTPSIETIHISPTQYLIGPTSIVVHPEPRPTVIGYSVKGQDIKVYRFGYGTKERMVVAGIHGGYEWNTIALADELIEFLSENPGFIPASKRLFILRSLNPDGEMRSHDYYGRANENGVDINRNFPDHWQETWNSEGCWDWLPISAGSSPASEPETQALMHFIQTHRIEALISYHSAGLGIFPGGRPPDKNSTSLAIRLGEISPYPYPPIDNGCEFTGMMADWLSRHGIAAVDIELTNHEETDFEINLMILDAFLNWEPD